MDLSNLIDDLFLNAISIDSDGRDRNAVTARRNQVKFSLRSLENIRRMLIEKARPMRPDRGGPKSPGVTGCNERVVVERIHDLKQYLNDLAPISRLPNEILHYILSLRIRHFLDPFRLSILSRSSCPIDSLGWISVTHVCRLWREVVIGDPLFWTQINFLSTWAIEMLSRSRQYPLFVRGDLFDLTPKNAGTVGTVLCQLPRIQELSLNIPSVDTLTSNLLQPAPILHSLAIRVFFTFGCHPLPSPLFAGQAPQLRQLSLENCHLPWDSPFLSQVTHLRLAKIELDISIPQFFDIFRGFPNLQELLIDNVMPAGWRQMAAHSLPPVNMPQLSMLTLMGPFDFCNVFLDRLCLPKHPILHLALCYRPGHNTSFSDIVAPFLRHIANQKRPIRYLSISDSSMRVEGSDDAVIKGPHNLRFTLRMTANLPCSLARHIWSQALAGLLMHPWFKHHLYILRMQHPNMKPGFLDSVSSLEKVHTIILDFNKRNQWVTFITCTRPPDKWPDLRAIFFASPIFSQDLGDVELEGRIRLLVAYLKRRIQCGLGIKKLQFVSSDSSAPAVVSLRSLVPEICFT